MGTAGAAWTDGGPPAQPGCSGAGRAVGGTGGRAEGHVSRRLRGARRRWGLVHDLPISTTGDAEKLRGYFTEDVVYHNIPLEPSVGIDATIAFIDSFFAMCDSMTIETTHLAVRDDVVLTERIDTFHIGDTVAPLASHGDVRDP